MTKAAIRSLAGLPRSAALLFSSFGILVIVGLSALTAAAQIDQDLSYPPPVRVASKAERQNLATAKNIKERTRLALALMETRLTAAEKCATATDFDGLYRELGFFEGILDNQLDYLIRNDNDSGRVLDNFKRLEIGLRGFTPRVESIRRELPLRYEPYVRSVGKALRDARSRALEPLFSDTVVPNSKEP